MVGEPAEFPLLRLVHAPGRRGGHAASRTGRTSEELAPIETTLDAERRAKRAGRVVPVRLRSRRSPRSARSSSWCVAGERRAPLEARVQRAGEREHERHGRASAPGVPLRARRPASIVGIDLGTTNTAVACVDLRGSRAPASPIQLLRVPAARRRRARCQRRRCCPRSSTCPGRTSCRPAAAALPWARSAADAVSASSPADQGARCPARLVASAKSWLCHAAVDRQAAILPWGAPSEVPQGLAGGGQRRATSHHMREAWNHSRARRGRAVLEEQDGGADRAGLVRRGGPRADRGGRAPGRARRRCACSRSRRPPSTTGSSATERRLARRWVEPGELVLVCDVGGGTTDFTLISRAAATAGAPRFDRIAVGDHLLLGGDNMDLALARGVELRWHGQQRSGLDASRWKALSHQCRQAKERVLGGEAGSSASL